MILSTILAALLTLQPGYNNTGAAGEVVAVSAATSNATATVAIKSVNTLTTYTNTTAHFGQAAVTNKVLLGGGILVTGAAEGDIINLLIK